MKSNSLILIAIFSFLLFSCDSGIKFDNPKDQHNADKQDSGDTEQSDDSDPIDSEPEDTDTDDDSDTTPEEPDNGDSEPDNNDTDDSESALDGDSTPDDDADTSDSTDDSGDSQPDESNTTDDGDTSTPDEEPATRTETCSGLPANASWHNGSSITQTFDGNDWYPPATGFYSETAVANECGFKCNQVFFWDGDWGKCFIRPAFGNICTGQTKCFNNSEEITCPTSASANFYGQDAQYAKLGYCYPQSFSIKTIVAGQNIVVDNNTGLEWQQVISEDSFTWEDAITHCEDLNYGGYTDWRLPDPLELLTIVDNNKRDPAVDTNYFVNAKLWTSKSYPLDATKAFYLGLPSYGLIWYNQNKTSPINAMCVRGNEFQKPTHTASTINNEVVIEDSVTGLIWQKTYGTEKDWQNALDYCENLTYAGYSDWRLPNKNELASLINYDKPEAPYSDFPDMPSKFFWIASTTARTPTAENGWGINFKNGTVSDLRKTEGGGYARCVRSEKINDPCENHACGSMAHSTGVCIPENAFEYSCGCDEGYFWNGIQCKIMPECSASSGTPCKDLTNHLTWSAKSSSKMTWQNAVDYCYNYMEDGLRGWHLPNIDELKTLLIWNKANSCKVSEINDCLSYDVNCWSCSTCVANGVQASSSIGCDSWGTTYTDGRYSIFGDKDYFWSSSPVSNETDSVWRVNFGSGDLNHYENSKSIYVRCVR